MGALLDSFLSSQKPGNQNNSPTNAGGGTLLQSFHANAAQLQAQPKVTTTVKKVSSTPTPAPKPAQTGFLDKAAQSFNSLSNKTREVIKGVNFKLVAPTKIEPTVPKPTVTQTPQQPVDDAPKYKTPEVGKKLTATEMPKSYLSQAPKKNAVG